MHQTIPFSRNFLHATVLFCTVAACAVAQPLSPPGTGNQPPIILNAASLATNVPVAPGSIVTVLGGPFVSGQAGVAQDPKALPTTLRGVSVSIAGIAAGLYYVAPTQINLVVPPSAPVGQQTMTIVTPSGNIGATIQLARPAAPGLFSLFGTGTRDAAAVDAVTGRIGAFSPRPVNGATTYLSFFATGADFGVAPTLTAGGVPLSIQFFGDAPCCVGLQQINAVLPPSLAGAGRVSVVLQAGGRTSNPVEIVLLPAVAEGPFKDAEDNKNRFRELASIAWIPGTSLAIVTDENGDVARIVDVLQRRVVRTIALPSDSEPISVAVDAAGKFALVPLRGSDKVALIDLTTYSVAAQITVGLAPVAAAFGTASAIVVNGDADTASIVNLATRAVVATLPTGRGPRAVALDPASQTAYIANQTAGTLTVISLATNTVQRTINLGADVRPAAIALVNAGFALVTDPGAGPDGQVLLVNLLTGATSTARANPDRSGGSTDVAVLGNRVFFANQTGASVSWVDVVNGAFQGQPAAVRVNIGARALAIDAKDNLLLVVSQGSGEVVIVDLATLRVSGRIVGVKGEDEDEAKDDDDDRRGARNLPVLNRVSPNSGRAGTTVQLTLTGERLAGATQLLFFLPSDAPGRGHGRDKKEREKGKGPFATRDTAFTVTNIQVNAAGTQIIATAQIAPAAAAGARYIRVATPNGESASTEVRFTVTP